MGILFLPCVNTLAFWDPAVAPALYRWSYNGGDGTLV